MSIEQKELLAMDPVIDIEPQISPRDELKQFTDDFINNLLEKVQIAGHARARVKVDFKNNWVNNIYEHKKDEDTRKLLIIRTPLVRPLGENVTPMPTTSWTEYEIADPNSDFEDPSYPHFRVRQSSDGEVTIDLNNPTRGHFSGANLPSLQDLEKTLYQDFLI